MNNNQRNAWIAVVVIVILIIIGVIVWRANKPSQNGSETASTTGASMILPYGQVTLGLGETGAFQGIAIKPLKVTEDSRCASGVQCVWAGTTKVNVESTLDSGPAVQNIMTLGSTTPISTFTVSLISVYPAPKAGEKIADKDYRFTFEVHQGANNEGNLQGKG